MRRQTPTCPWRRERPLPTEDNPRPHQISPGPVLRPPACRDGVCPPTIPSPVPSSIDPRLSLTGPRGSECAEGCRRDKAREGGHPLARDPGSKDGLEPLAPDGGYHLVRKFSISVEMASHRIPKIAEVAKSRSKGQDGRRYHPGQSKISLLRRSSSRR